MGIDFQEWRESKFAFSDKSFLGIASQLCKNLPDIVGLSLHDVEEWQVRYLETKQPCTQRMKKKVFSLFSKTLNIDLWKVHRFLGFTEKKGKITAIIYSDFFCHCRSYFFFYFLFFRKKKFTVFRQNLMIQYNHIKCNTLL